MCCEDANGLGAVIDTFADEGEGSGSSVEEEGAKDGGGGLWFQSFLAKEELQIGNDFLAAESDFANGGFDDGRSLIGEKIDESSVREGLEVDAFSVGIEGTLFVGFFDSINRAEDVGFCELRGRTTDFVPATCIDDEDASVGVFDDISGVKVVVVGNDEVGIYASVRCAKRLHAVADNLA